MRSIVIGLVMLVVLFPGAVAAGPDPDIEMFTRKGCPYCGAALAFLEQLGRERPGLRIEVRDVQEDPQALERLVALGRKHGVEHLGVPAFHVRGGLVIGFAGPETTGAELEALLETPVPGAAGAPSRASGN